MESEQHNHNVIMPACGFCQNAKPLDFQFDYAYQPIVDYDNKQIFGYEALVRGCQGESAFSVLSKISEENRYSFDQACRVKAVKGAASLGITGKLSINFMPNAVYDPTTCIQSTFKAAREYNFPIEQIIFEVTEDEKVMDKNHLVNIFREYKRFGFMTALDDFGSGFSGLNFLADYQPDILKIDMHLVRDINSSRPKQAILRGIVAMCQDLNIQVLAEGIETKSERDFLHSVGITLMQGFWFAKPFFKDLGHINASAWS